MESSSIEIVDLRHLLPAAMEAVLSDEGRVWERDLLWDYSSTAGMIRRFLEGRALAGYAAIENRQAVGFTFYVYEAGKGLIGDLFVRPEFQRDAVHFRLLTSTLETLEATPGIRRVEAQLLHADTSGVRALFHSRAYVCHDRSFLKLEVASLPTDSVAPQHPPNGFRIAQWEAGKFLDSANLITRAYAGHIDCEVSDQYRTQSGALRFLDNIIHYPGCGEFYPPASLLSFPEDASDGQPCGMILSSVVSPRVAHITQLCVAPECRGRRLGQALLEKALAEMKERGFRTVTLTATDANEGAMNLYRKMGFTTMLRFPAFVWENSWSAAAPTGHFISGRP